MRNFFLLLVLLISLNSFSQEEPFRCLNANPELKNLISEGYLSEIELDGFGEGSFTSSYLKTSGKKPENMEEGCWKCQYSPANLSDNNTKTAWVEGVKDYGIGEFIIVPRLDLKKTVKIWNGYGKSKYLYFANSRPSKIKLYIIQAKYGNVSQFGGFYKDLTIITSKTISLKDINNFQTIQLPKFNFEKYYSEIFEQETEYQYFLGIEIIDVYKGSKWADTCISEIAND